jgi:hypothetical protein
MIRAEGRGLGKRKMKIDRWLKKQENTCLFLQCQRNLTQGYESYGDGGLYPVLRLNSARVPVKYMKHHPTPTDGLWGYSLYISYQGSKAFEVCPPETLFREYLDTAAKPNDEVAFIS